MKQFSSEEKTEDGKPLLSGYLLDMNQWQTDDLEDTRPEQIKKAIREVSQKHKEFKEPYIILDLIERENIKLFDNEGHEIPAEIEEGDKGRILRVVVSAWSIVDLRNISNSGNSIVKANAAIPVYRWFQAANLLLKYTDVVGRLIPFPLDQEKGETVYHMLRSTPAEFASYQQILEFATSQFNILERAFETSARFSYEVLKNRGITELTAKQVDSTLTHVILMRDSTIFGLALANSTDTDVTSPTLQTNSIFF